MAETIKGINVVLGAETTALSKALSDVNKKSRDIQGELRQVERLLKLDPTNTELLAQKQKLLSDAVANTREKLERLRTAQEQVNEQFRRGEISEGQYRAFQREIAATEQQLRRLESQAGNTSRSMAEIGQSMESAGRKMTDAGKSLAMKVTAPIVGLGAVITKTGMDFEAAMSEVGAISGATGEDLQALENIAKEMGATTKFSASQAAEGLKYMAMAGWDTQKMLDGLPGMLSLAAASGEDLGLVADIVTDAMTAFGMEASRAGEFADTIAAASANANTNVAMLGESFKYVAPLAGALGYSAKDTAVALGIMANAGIKGSQSGTALRAILTRLVKPPADAAKAMDALGLSVTNSDGTMKSLAEVMDDLRESFAKLGPEQQATFAAQIAGQEAMSGLLALVNTGEADFNKLTNAINNSEGAAQRMAAQMQDNLQGRLTVLKSALEGVALQLYEHLQPALEKLVAVLQKVVDWFAKLGPGTQATILGVAALAAAIGPLLVILGLMASGLGAILTILPMLGATFAIVTGPIGIVVAAITTLVASLVYLYKTNEEVRANIQTVWEGIKTIIDAVMPAILFIIKSVWNNIKGVISGVLNVIEGLVSVFAGILTGDFKAMWEGIKQIFSGAIEFIFNFVQLMFVGKILAIFKNFAKAGFELLKGNWANILNGVKQFETNILNLFRGLWDNTISTFNTFRNTGTGIFNAIRNTLTSIVQGLVNAVRNLFTGMSSAVTNTMSSLKSSIQGIWNNIMSFFRGINLRDIGQDIIRGLINGITSMASEAMRAARNLADSVSSTIKSALRISSPSKVMEGYGKFISEGLAQGIDAAKYKVSDSAMRLVGEVTTPVIQTPSAAVAAVGGVTITGNTFYIRNDNDIKRVAQELYYLQQGALRGKGR